MANGLEQQATRFGRIKRYIAGIVAGNADNDPGAITTYSIGGASTGYSQLWLMVLSIPIMIAIQTMCARIGTVTRKGLGAVIKDRFPKPVAWISIFILLASTIITIGADLAGMGAAFQLIFHVPLRLWIVPVALAVWMLVLFTDFQTFTRFMAGIVVFFIAYIASAFLSGPDWGEVAGNIVLPPVRFDADYVTSAVGILGATLTPTLFFWQAQEEIEEKGPKKKARTLHRTLAPGFIFAQLIVMFIIIATAASLHARGIRIQTAADAARALEPLAGPFAKYLFAAGIVGAGLIAVPVMAASAGYMVAELFGWQQSLSDKVDQAKGFYIVITLALFTGVEIALSGIDPVKALLYSQMLGGAVSPMLVTLLLIIGNNRKIMGKYTNTAFDNIFSVLAVLVMTGSVVLLFLQGGP